MADQRKASQVPWDSPTRTRRIDEKDQPISDAEHARYYWYDITSLYDEDDVRRLVRTGKKEGQ